MLKLALIIGLIGLNSDHKDLVNMGRYDEAIALKSACKFNGQFFFYQAVAYFKIKEYKLSKQSAEQAFFYSLPERYEVVLVGLLAEIERIKDNDKMADISTDMDMVTNRLKNAKGGAKTQDIQKKIVAKLDEEIKKIEDEINKSKEQGGSSASNIKVPASDSGIIKEVPPKGEISNKKLVQTSENWGNLPKKEKIQMMEKITLQLPSHMREASEGFSKALQNKGKVP